MKQKKVLGVLLSLVIIFTSIPMEALAVFETTSQGQLQGVGTQTTPLSIKNRAFAGTGSGTATAPYEIRTTTDLYTVNDNLTAHYILMNDIDLNGQPFTMIGIDSNFSGVFDGNGYQIKNVNLLYPTRDKVGLFSSCTGTIQNLGIENVDVSGNNYVGGLVGYLTTNGKINNCYVTGSGTIKAAANHLGGLVGYFHGSNINISNCYVTKNLSSSNGYVGGIVGYINGIGTISNCYATGSVSGSNYIGGLIGHTNANGGSVILNNCYYVGNVEASSTMAGGLIGYAYSHPSYPQYRTLVNYCYSIAAVSASGSYAAGLIGYHSTQHYLITHSYSASSVSSSIKAGLVYDSTGTYNHNLFDSSYYDTTAIGSTTLVDKNQGRAGDAMLLQSTYVSWDMSNIWLMDLRSTYPYLRALPKPSEVVVNPDEIAVTNIAFNTNSMQMYPDTNQTLGYTITPSNANNKNVTWTSDNTDVASVSSTGVVTARALGTANITIKTVDGGFTDTCTITVNPVKVTSVQFTPKALTIKANESQTIAYNVIPANATNKIVTWFSNDTNIAVVDSNGILTGKAAGTTVIVVKTQDGEFTDYLSLTVTAPDIQVTGVKVDPSTKKMIVGETITLTKTISPSNAYNQNVTWASDNTEVATVSSTGTVTAKAAGNTVITATTVNGSFKDTCTITVDSIPVTNISFVSDSAEVNVDESIKLNYTITPTTASNQNVTWESYRKSVATVDSQGNVLGIAEGSATIVVRTIDGNFIDICSVDVTSKTKNVTSVQVDKKEITLEIGEKYQLNAEITPKDASNLTVTWSSSNKTVAGVSKGNVTAKEAGTTTIRVKTADGGYMATCEVTVISSNQGDSNVTGVEFSQSSALIYVGDSTELSYIVKPSDASNKNVIWSSSNSSVASVSNGTVAGLSEGTTEIKVKTVDGGFEAVCSLTVAPSSNTNTISVEKIELNTDTIELKVGETYQLSTIITPSDASNQAVTWSSGDKTVASVSKGKVNAKQAGKTTITAKTSDGGLKAVCEVTVVNGA